MDFPNNIVQLHTVVRHERIMLFSLSHFLSTYGSQITVHAHHLKDTLQSARLKQWPCLETRNKSEAVQDKAVKQYKRNHDNDDIQSNVLRYIPTIICTHVLTYIDTCSYIHTCMHPRTNVGM
jgi:hypothetical protein